MAAENTEQAEPPVEPRISVKHLIDCSLPVWYPKLKAHTFRTRFITVSKEFEEYLREDGVFLPEQLEKEEAEYEREEEPESDCEIDWDVGEMKYEERDFRELIASIRAGIRELGGAVFPKLTWSSPRDATWMLPGNQIRCTTASEVFRVFKASCLLVDDVDHAFEICDGPCPEGFSHTLCLRKWGSLIPSAEFRCFIKGGRIRACCQRHLEFIDHLAVQSAVDEVKQLLSAFVSEKLWSLLALNGEDLIVADLYISKTRQVYVIDLNPFHPKTDGILWNWVEINEACEGTSETNAGATDFELKLVKSKNRGMPSGLEQYRYPADIQLVPAQEFLSSMPDEMVAYARELQRSTQENEKSREA